jgi:glycosyltransferase involved in cell wall biosynthesis
MPKLLFVGPYPPPFGGIASHLKDLLPKLQTAGHKIISLTWSPSERVDRDNGMKNIYSSPNAFFLKHILRVLYNSILCYRYMNKMSLREILRTVNKALIIKKIYQDESISTIFIYDNQNGHVIPILRKRFGFDGTLLFMIFGDYYLHPEEYKERSEYVIDALQGSNYLLASSQHCADSISNVLGYDMLVKVIYVGVDEQIYSPQVSGAYLRSELSIPRSATVILFLGRLVKEMGLDFLLENIHDILDIDESIYVIIAGAKGNLGELVSEVAIKNDRVKYCPDIAFEQKAQFYRASDILMAPSMENHACMGVSIKEAMSCEIPVIASTSGGIPEAVEDGINGYLIPIESGKLVKNVFLARVTRLVQDRELRINMGHKGRDKVLKIFTNKRTVEKYLLLLKQIFQAN